MIQTGARLIPRQHGPREDTKPWARAPQGPARPHSPWQSTWSGRCWRCVVAVGPSPFCYSHMHTTLCVCVHSCMCAHVHTHACCVVHRLKSKGTACKQQVTAIQQRSNRNFLIHQHKLGGKPPCFWPLWSQLRLHSQSSLQRHQNYADLKQGTNLNSFFLLKRLHSEAVEFTC